MGKKLLKTHKVSFNDEEIKFAWFTIVTIPGHERKVAEILRMRFQNMAAADKFREVFVPIREWEERVEGRMKKDGTRTIRKVKKSENVLESGYIFINMVMNNHTWNIVRQTTGVAGWLNMDGRPQEVPSSDIAKWKSFIEQENKESNEFKGKIGGYVEITDGPFKGYEGKIITIKELSALITVSTLNNTELEISHDQLKIM